HREPPEAAQRAELLFHAVDAHDEALVMCRRDAVQRRQDLVQLRQDLVDLLLLRHCQLPSQNETEEAPQRLQVRQQPQPQVVERGRRNGLGRLRERRGASRAPQADQQRQGSGQGSSALHAEPSPAAALRFCRSCSMRPFSCRLSSACLPNRAASSRYSIYSLGSSCPSPSLSAAFLACSWTSPAFARTSSAWRRPSLRSASRPSTASRSSLAASRSCLAC